MTNNNVSLQPQAARLAGVAYLFLVLGGIAYWFLVGSKLATTNGNVLGNELLFRIDVAYQLLMSVNVVALAVAHFAILKPLKRTLTAVALCLVLAESFLVAVLALLSFLALHLLNNQSSLTALGQTQLQGLVSLFLNVRLAGHTISTVFLDLGMVFFFYLLLLSRYIPRALAYFGLVSYVLMLGSAIVNIVVPGSPTSFMTLQSGLDIVVVTPSILLEFVAGAWLLAKGLDLRAVVHPALGPAVQPSGT